LSARAAFKFTDGFLRLALRLGFAGLGRVLQLQAGFVQFFLRLAALLFQLGQQFFASASAASRHLPSVRASCPKVAGAVQRRTYWLLLADMIYLLADEIAAHTMLLLLPPLGHVDSISSAALHAWAKLLSCSKKQV
jgi:hypothetical protein